MRQDSLSPGQSLCASSRSCYPFSRRLIFVFALLLLSINSALSAQTSQANVSSGASVTKALGTVKSIQPDSITVAVETGGEITATISSSTKILRVPPGEKDLQNAVPLQSKEVKPGDRVLVRGNQSVDSHSLTALAIIVMKHTDVAAKQDQERADWQKRGVGGLVTAVDAGANIITISSSAIGKKQNIAVHIGQDTILRVYAPGSVKFDDAKVTPASQFMVQVKAGDQLRARGTRSTDGAEITAQEIVAGSFRNIAGAIQAIDMANKTITVRDAISKTDVVVSLSADSQIKKLTPEMAQRIATRLKAAGNIDAGTAHGPGQAQAAPREQRSADSNAPSSPRVRGEGADSGGGAGGSGPPDLQRLLSRLASNSISDLKSGDAVMMVATEGEGASKATAITLLAGVEPILTATPSRSASSLLSPWSLSTGDTETP